MSKLNNELTIPFALVGDKMTSIENYVKMFFLDDRYDRSYIPDAFCPECGEKLIFKNGDIKVKHWSHKINSECAYKSAKTSGNTKKHIAETFEHKFAKQFIKHNIRSTFYDVCDRVVFENGSPTLGGGSYLNVKNVEVESTRLKGVLGLESAYIPDVLIETDGKFIALEIYYSNKKIPDDLKELLRGKNISVYELDIKHIGGLSIRELYKKMKLIYSQEKLALEEYLGNKTNETIGYNKCIEEVKELRTEKVELIAKNKRIQHQNDMLILKCETYENLLSQENISQLENENKELLELRDKYEKLEREYNSLSNKNKKLMEHIEGMEYWK